MNQCQSCGMPLETDSDHGAGDINNPYCQYCTDEQGNLLPEETVREKITNFYAKAFGKTPEQAAADAENLMAEMPAWKKQEEPSLETPPTEPSPELIPQPPSPAMPTQPSAAPPFVAKPTASGESSVRRPNLPFANQPPSPVSQKPFGAPSVPSQQFGPKPEPVSSQFPRPSGFQPKPGQ